MSLTVEVAGVRETEAKLAELGQVKIPAAMRKVTVAGAKPMRAAIRAAAPVGKVARPKQNDVPGNLRRSVRYKASRGSKGLRYVVGAFGKGSAHRHLVLYGHEIKGHAHSVLGVQLSTKFGHQSTSRSGERTKPNPFIARGAEAAREASVAAIEAAARVAIEEATKL